MDGTQTIDYGALARQHGATSSQPAQIDYDALAKQHGAISSTAPPSAAAVPGVPTGSITAYHPDVWQRVKDFVAPFVQHVQVGGSAPDERLLAPEALMTPEQQQAHPIVAGAADFAGGMTTGSNLALMAVSGGLGKVPGIAGKVLPRVASGVFSAQTLRGAYNELPEFRAAWDRGDMQQVERIGTHVLLGAVMAGLGAKHAATGEPVSGTERSVSESYRKAGESFAKLKQGSVSLNSISEAATGLYNSIRNDLITHQGALRNDGARTIQDAINADKTALMNTNRGSISTAGAVAEAVKTIDATKYEMKPAERSMLNRILNQPEMTLEEAKAARTVFGAAAARARRAGNAQLNSIYTAAYNQLGEGMKTRITELQGSSRPYEHYNNQFKASFELEDGIAGKMMESLQGQDRHAAIPKIKEFVGANLDEIKEQMQKLGLRDQVKSLDRAKEHAKALVDAHDIVNGKYVSGIYRLFMQNRKEAWPGLAVMIAGHGMGLPFPVPQIAGAAVGVGSIGMRGKAAAARVGQELKTTLPPEYFRTRTEAEAPETFTYKDPDEGWLPGTSSPPSGPTTILEPKADAVKRALARRRIQRHDASD